MKNYHEWRRNFAEFLPRKLMLIMKFTIGLFLLVGFHAMASGSYAQETKVTVKMKNAHVKEVLQEIERSSEFFFVYNNRLVDVEKVVDVDAEGEMIRDILDRLFDKEEVSYTVMGRQIVLSPSEMMSDDKFAQQQQEVRGKVTDQSGEPIPGANVVLKGSPATGAITDIDGNYVLDGVDENSVLVFSFVGFENQELPLNGRSVINVTLKQATIGLDEVVAVGYGYTKKRDLTGSVAQVKSETIEKIPSTTIQDALAGNVAGTMVRNASGDDPNGGSYIMIRGISSTNGAANSPLYVIDGVPLFDANLRTIDPNIIESVEVLKDASATAIYGARAAAGVILITTKKGEKGTANVEFSASYGVQNAAKTYDVLSGQEHWDLVMQGWELDFTQEQLDNNNRYQQYFDPVIYDAEKGGVRYNFPWTESFLVDNAPWQKYSIGLNGGNDKFTYNVIGAYEDRDGIIIGSGLERYSLNATFNVDVSEKVKMGLSLIGNYSESVQRADVGGLWGGYSYMQTVITPPWVPAYDEEGNWIDLPTDEETRGKFVLNRASAWNKLWRTSNRDYSSRNRRVMSNFNVEWKPVKDLTLRTSVGIDMLWKDGRYIDHMLPFQRPFPMVRNNRSYNESLNYVLDEVATYEKVIGNDHRVKAMAGASLQENSTDFLQLSINGSTNDNLDQIGNMPTYLKDEDGNIINSIGKGGMPTTVRLASFFGRLNYTFLERYLLTATLRHDGSSKFGVNNKFGTFPAVGLGWHINEESFMEQFTFIDNLKLRGSWGQTGNQSPIGNFTYLSTAYSAGSVFGLQTQPASMGNAGIRWEVVEQTDIGFDLSLFDNRIGVIFDWYNRESKDMLGSLPLNPASGYNNIAGNLGSIQNQGVELSLNTSNIRRNDFQWNTNFNIAFNKNKVLDLGTLPDGSKKDDIVSGNNITSIGEPMGMFYLWKFDGVWQEEETEEAQKYNRVPGSYKYVDVNGDNVYNRDDKAVYGNPHPKFTGGMTNRLQYKDVELSFLFTFMGGHQLLNNVKMRIESGHPPFNQTTEMMKNSWTPENRSNRYQRMWNFSNSKTDVASSTRMLEDADFLKLSNVSLNYNLPERWLEYARLKRARIGISAKNLITITDYSGLDPEAEAATANPWVNGIDNTPYPSAKTVLFNLKLSF